MTLLLDRLDIKIVLQYVIGKMQSAAFSFFTLFISIYIGFQHCTILRRNFLVASVTQYEKQNFCF
jgi:hypothetical protein